MAEDDMYTKDGTVDYRGNHADKSKTGTWKACPYILGNCVIHLLIQFRNAWGVLKHIFNGNECHVECYVTVHILVVDVISVTWIITSICKCGKSYVNCR